MPDNLNIKHPEDGQRINTGQPHELAYWAKRFGCTEREIIDAVERVGTSAQKVQDYLR